MEARAHTPLWCRAIERSPPREHLEADDPERLDIGADRKTMNESAAKRLQPRNVPPRRRGDISAKVTIAMSHAADPIEELAAHLDRPPYVFLSHSHTTGHRSSSR